MAPSHHKKLDKSSKYAISASKGFTYYLPKSAQQPLQELLKQLPSTARSIYNEYYRDVMAAKSCASGSALAMAKFVTGSFPTVARLHNQFARDMNKEIDSDEHEGYVPTFFPIVPEPQDEREERAVKKRKCTVITAETHEPASAISRTPPHRQVLQDIGVSTSRPQNATNSAVTPLSGSSIARGSKADATQGATDKGIDTLPRTAISEHTTEVVYKLNPDHVDWHSQDSTPLFDALPSEVLDSEDKLVGKPYEQIVDDFDDEKCGADFNHPHPVGGAPEGHTAMLRHTLDLNSAANAAHETPKGNLNSPLPGTPPGEVLDKKDFAMGEPEEQMERRHNDESPKLGYEILSEEQMWEDGIKVIEAFRWDRPGSRWKPRRGLVSKYYEYTETPTGMRGVLFKEYHWADGSEELYGLEVPIITTPSEVPT
jgi:hypothetical protein